ncbi:MAG: acyl-CoA desaturase [Opitutales bacterium]|jgi:stearoyl-CoA desaturase (delta-9 desaturase)|nr:MAG: acyl-CoA desaturase [Opitutales bacterium]
MKFKNFPIYRIEWVTSIFLIGTALLSLTVVPWFLWTQYHLPAEAVNKVHGWGFVWALFIFYYYATGFGITLGYHRLFSHLSFKAKWPVKLFVLLFGAASFENSAHDWCADHRIHHKHVDEDADPYDISKGFFYAHIGWLLFRLKPPTPTNNVKDLEADPLVMWQHRYVQWIGAFVGFVMPAVLGYAFAVLNGYTNPGMTALAAFLIAGLLRTVIVQQGTFCINSLCHMIGRQPYSTSHSARDSGAVALLTFGEGYHNYHHEFQHDYRNGVKAWQFDPTKWIIWTLSWLGLTEDLRRVPDSRIMAAELKEKSLTLGRDIDSLAARLDARTRELKAKTIAAAHELAKELGARAESLKEAATTQAEVGHETLSELRGLLNQAASYLETLRRADAGSAA